ncbi:helix-turn-helix domain-containing protein [Bosea sp. NPDC055594]
MSAATTTPLPPSCQLGPTRLAYSICEAAKACGLSRATIYRLIQAGEIVPRKCGHRTLVLAADLQRFLDKLPVGPRGL